MTEPLGVRVEVWPVAADANGIWLVSGADAWRPDLPVAADAEPHDEIELIMAEHGTTASLLHSTSWRMDGPALMVTYVALVEVDDLVLDEWPDAQPITTALTDVVGRPAKHQPTEAPAPRYIDVLIHALRHLAWLLETDASNRTAMDANWRRHLKTFRPTLAGMYDEHRKAV